MLAEVWNERFFYFCFKWDLNFVDNQDKAAALSTDQIDVENAKRYEITYVDEKGEKQYPLILHCTPSGAIERDIYALLEKAYREQMAGKAPMLPLWLSPTQVDLSQYQTSSLTKLDEIAKQIGSHASASTLTTVHQHCKRRSVKPNRNGYLTLLWSAKKKSSQGCLSVRDREVKGQQQNMTAGQLIVKVSEKIAVNLSSLCRCHVSFVESPVPRLINEL